MHAYARSIIGALGLALLCAAPASAKTHSYFDMTETFSSDQSAFHKWNRMVDHYRDQLSLPDSECDRAPYFPCTVKDWRKFVDRQQGKDFHAMLASVDHFANTFPYIDDWTNWGVEDYWETPYEFLAVSGNCKDYAIIKYYSLKKLGIPDERLRVIVLEDLNLGGVIHAVLGVYDNNGELWLLDNQIKQVVNAKHVYHYKPIYGINEQGWWAYYPK
jgi:predicted transglutaminase-like cysteine proteinase